MVFLLLINNIILELTTSIWKGVNSKIHYFNSKYYSFFLVRLTMIRWEPPVFCVTYRCKTVHFNQFFVSRLLNFSNYFLFLVHCIFLLSESLESLYSVFETYIIFIINSKWNEQPSSYHSKHRLNQIIFFCSANRRRNQQLCPIPCANHRRCSRILGINRSHLGPNDRLHEAQKQQLQQRSGHDRCNQWSVRIISAVLYDEKSLKKY